MPRATADIRSLARRHTSMAINTLAAIARKGKSEPARVSAAVALLERGWGKPTGDDNGGSASITVTIRKLITDNEGGAAPLIDVSPRKLDVNGDG